MKKPFFSILIPVYNVEKYLSACLESVLRQSFTNYEVILVDDGSKDSSGKICDDYAARYPDKIQVKHKPNQGLISARRAGLKLANGYYVCFLDSDDCWMENTLSRLYEIIQSTDSDVILYQWNRIDENGYTLKETIPGVFPKTGPIDKKTVFERMLTTALVNPLWAKCCKLELFDVDTDYSRYYTIQNGEDLVQSLPVLYQAKTFYYLAEKLYQYRVNMASITHVYQKKQYRTLSILRPLLFEYIEKMGLDSEQNRNLFFRTYLSILWENIEAMYAGIPSEEEKNAALDEVRSYEFVKKSREYLTHCTLPLRTRLGLLAFYRSDKALNSYLRAYLPMLKIIRKLKSTFGGNKR